MKTTNQLAEDLTKKWADEGKLIEGGFEALRLLVIPADASEVQVREMRMAFMAGAQHLFGSIMTIMDPGSEPTESDMHRMNFIQAELEAFAREIKLRASGKG